MTKDLNYYMHLRYPIETFPLTEDEGGGYFIRIPMLAGCMSDGDTLEEAYRNIEDAKESWLGSMLERELAIPEPPDDCDVLTDEELNRLATNVLKSEFGVRAVKRFISFQKKQIMDEIFKLQSDCFAQHGYRPQRAARIAANG